MNKKGYLLIEIILASAIAFGIAIFIFELTIKVKNRNDDLFVETQMATDQAIISNKLMAFAIAEKENFSCDRLSYDKDNAKEIYYTPVGSSTPELVDIVNDYGTIKKEEVKCSTLNGKIHIEFPLEVVQQKGKDYDVYVDYRYRIGDYSAPQMSLFVKGGTSWKMTNSATITISDNTGLKGGHYEIKYGWSSAANVDCSMLNGSHTFNVLDGTKELSFETTVGGETGDGNFYVCNKVDNPLIDMDDNRYELSSGTPLFSKMRLDNTKPTIELGVYTENTTSGTSITIPLIISDIGSGINTDTVKKDYIKLTIDDIPIANYELVKGNGDEYNIVAETDNKIGVAKIHVDPNRLKDNAGNGNELTDLELNLSSSDLYKVTYSGGSCSGVSGSMSSSTAILGEQFVPRVNKFLCPGNSFNGWKDKDGVSYPVTGLTWTKKANVQLIAQWAINKVTIKYNVNGGTWAGSSSTRYGVSGSFVTKDGSILQHKLNYSETGDLYNYNNASAINLSKSGYKAVSGKEWCTGTKGNGNCFDQTKNYNATDFCDLTSGDCTITLYVNWADSTGPEASITTTSNLKATKQTATLNCTDNVGVVGYYYGTTKPSSTTKYTAVTSTKSMSIKETIEEKGTYYLVCKDAAGNKSENAIQVYYKYNVDNRFETVDGSAGTYTTDNYATSGSVKTYLAPKDTEITLSDVYTIPNYSSSGNFKGMSVGSASTTSATLTKKAQTLSANNTTYTMWFNRNRIYFSYNPNGGTVKKTTKSKDGNTTYKWSVTDNLVYRSTNGGTASQLKTNIKYGATTLNLNDYNYEYYLNITKSGYSGKSGEEWLCSSGCKTSNMKFSQAKMTVKTTDICDVETLKKQNCNVTIKVNWVNEFTVTLDLGKVTRYSYLLFEDISPTIDFATSGSVYAFEYATINKWKELGGSVDGTIGLISSLTGKPTFKMKSGATYGDNLVGFKVDRLGFVSYNSVTLFTAEYDFDGWYTEASGGTLVVNTDKFTANKDITLYGHWTFNPPPADEPSDGGGGACDSGCCSCNCPSCRPAGPGLGGGGHAYG